MIESLPKHLSALTHAQLRHARDRRDARMSTLFRRWPALSKTEMTELKRLSDERQQLARHVGALRGLHRLRALRDPVVVEALYFSESRAQLLDVALVAELLRLRLRDDDPLAARPPASRLALLDPQGVSRARDRRR